MRTLQEKLIHIFLLLILFLFINAFNFEDNPPSGWYQQFLPNINNRTISDLQFLDSLTGYLVTSYVANDTAYILKTTNGGDNWNIVLRGPTNTIGGFNNIKFINQQTGFACGNFLWKTTNAGINWFNVNTSGIFPEHMYVLNQDTIWIIDSESLTGGVFRTTNGGTNWDRQLSLGSQNPTNVYFYNKNIGFVSQNGSGAYVRKTTNSGVNWSVIVNGEGFTDIHFQDSLTGLKCWGEVDSVSKTTNGGVNWVKYGLPKISPGLSNIKKFSFINSDTIWGVNGYYVYPNSQFRGVIYTSTNGGINWFFQVPDTSIHVFYYQHIKFSNKLNGSAAAVQTVIRTKVGGDPLTSINPTISEIPKQYKLEQNYPNPFNPVTSFKFQVSSPKYVQVRVFDLQGKEITLLVNEKKNAGSYSVSFDASKYNLSSGIYFYSLYIEGALKDTKKMILLK
ncbi:MAG: T9SS type A sorting domain-containing protein [Ignavibacteria bacterium]|nr:T9SS type A sorting domain-containing protein [Ignavibacteria bacterium]